MQTLYLKTFFYLVTVSKSRLINTLSYLIKTVPKPNKNTLEVTSIIRTSSFFDAVLLKHPTLAFSHRV